MAYLNFTQRSTRKQEVEVKTLHYVMILQQGGCDSTVAGVCRNARGLLHQRLRALSGYLQYLSWAPALTQERLADPSGRRGTACCPGLPTTGIATW